MRVKCAKFEQQTLQAGNVTSLAEEKPHHPNGDHNGNQNYESVDDARRDHVTSETTGNNGQKLWLGEAVEESRDSRDYHDCKKRCHGVQLLCVG